VRVRLSSRLAVAAVFLALGLSAATAATSTSGGSVSVLSKRGVYKLNVSPRPATAPVGRLHTWTVVLRSANGMPVRRARIDVVGDMPAHGHGLPTKPRVRETAPGRYAIEGMKFQMGGTWYVEFRIVAAPGRDRARVRFTLPGGSG
jgi:YtkA-like